MILNLVQRVFPFPQGDLGPFNPGLPVQVPVWLALNLKQRQKCRIVPPEWMDAGEITWDEMFNNDHSVGVMVRCPQTFTY